ncbi:type II secretion system F family protein [Hydrogenothermus marinus]|uniref:Type IV pilus assembly protein PilC n=1 Tax=Hydrogenothermus marinus TaxID=133270 RepID=A0A3M0BN90_9AQUI|nr:type II secretion system F family protein [Hydrogenothermus marinus]RMA97749.1 type IV pilus assembly protein PilC [Hydrogenothermus marinus]
MPVYKYKALSKTGKEEKGTIEANSVSHLKNVLSKKNLILLEVEELGKSKKIKSLKDLNITFFKKQFSTDEIVFILYELGMLIGKNIHITSAIEIVANQQENSLLKKKLLKAKSLIAEGKTVAEAFEEIEIFPKFLTEMIKAGEEAGALGDIFISASEYLEKQNNFKSQIINSLIYPSIVIGVGFLSLIIIMNVVVPTVVKIYNQFGKELPTSTKIVIIFSSIFSLFLKSLPVILILGFILNRKYLKKDFWDRLKLKIPFFNKVLLYSQISSWANTTAILLKGGLQLTKALEIANSSISNQVLKEKLQEVIPQIEKGKKLADSLKEKQILPESSIQILSVGEETGQLEDMFQMIADIYKKQTEKLITRFITLLEPITLIILSVMIGFFIFATLFPIFNLSVKQ